MKLFSFIILSSLTFSAMAAECTLKTKARAKVYPLAFSFKEVVTEAVDLEDCIDLAKEKLGSQYKDLMVLVGGLDSAGGSATVTYVVKKVKYSFKQDGINYTGSLR